MSTVTRGGPSLASATTIIEQAVSARTLADVERLATLIVADVGAKFERPIGDRVNTLGWLSSSGSFDHKLLELFTNGQDAVLERYALRKFGSRQNVPYSSPREAARELLGGLHADEQAKLLRVDLYEADDSARQSKRVTPVARDLGCGIGPAYMATSIFFGGSTHKDAIFWQQGAYGMGGILTYRNAPAVVVISRRAPELLESGAEDRIAIAVCRWQRNVKGEGIFYLVTSAWPENGDAEPWSAKASAYPDFAPGTQIALVSYGTTGLYHGRNDRRGLEFMINTRLWDPVLPVQIENHVARGDHEKTLRGLKRRFEDNRRPDRKEATELMPFRINGTTYQLPVSYYYFSAGPSADMGGMRNFVYDGHALLFTSNGQCHKHWTPQDFRVKAPRLNKLYDRLLVVVETDAMPIEVRTAMFTPDRSGFVDKDEARRLEEAVAAFLSGWHELRMYNNEIIRRSLEPRDGERSTLALARKIARVLAARGGFSFQSDGGRTTDSEIDRVIRKFAKAELWPDPTTLEGPNRVTALPGETRFLYYHVNAVDEFFARGKLEVVSEHPRIGASEISVGELRGGRVRVSITIPDDIELCETRLLADVRGWTKASGGIGEDHSWTTELVVAETRAEPKGRGQTRTPKKKKPQGGPMVAIRWRRIADVPGWHAGVPGDVELTPASVLAEASEDYRELAGLDAEIPTVRLNEEFTHLKHYLEARLAAERRDLTSAGLDAAKDRYAVGVGTGLLLHHEELLRREKASEPVSERSELAERTAIARSVLAMMPEYDALASEVEF